MKFKKINDGYVVRIEKGEEIIQTLTDFCEQNNVKSGSIAGIGGTDDVSVSYYDQEKKEYIPKRYGGKNYEIISLNGNISLKEGKPFAHIHITLGDSDYSVFGGHLESAVISVNCEMVISMANDKVERKFDKDLQLNLLDL